MGICYFAEERENSLQIAARSVEWNQNDCFASPKLLNETKQAACSYQYVHIPHASDK